MCSLIKENYEPDTIKDLRKDESALEYWLDCFENLIKKFAKQAEQSQKSDPTSFKRSENFKEDYLNKLHKLKKNSTQNDEPITIRYLLDLNEKLLRLHGFNDPFLEQKGIENEASINSLKSRLNEIDQIESMQNRWLEIIKGLLAGNIFDWGAQAVSNILENSNNEFGLKNALLEIQKRPWLIDDLDEWLERLKGPSHKCAVIFVDNSGVDIVLGILPFARELLRRRTKVILCANDLPSLNDITSDELKKVLVKCCDESDEIRDAIANNQLLVYGNGQTTPCLDMRSLSHELYKAIEANETDLLIIEGMGRCVHTNLNAKFSCETLKLAVIKNKWLANKLGGDIFSVICKYEKL